MLRSAFFGILIGTALLLSAPGRSGGKPRKFFFLYSVNNSGYIDVCGCKHKKVKQGGMARRFTLIKELKALGKPFVLLDGGSCFFNIQDKLPKEFERKQLLAKAYVIVESMNRMGYRAMAMGSSDLLLGLDVLKRLASQARFPILCANFLGPDGKAVFPASTIIEVAGVRVGVIGLVMSTLNPRYLEKVAPGCRTEDAVAAAKKETARLKDKVDLIVALSHVRREENERLAEQVPEIGIIFDPNINYGSYSLFLADPKQWVDRYGKALVVRSDGEGMRLARVDVEFEVPFGEFRTSDELNRLERGVQADPVPEDMSAFLGRGAFNRAVVSRISIEPYYLPDPGIKALVDAWKREDPGKLDPKSLAELKALPLKYMGKEACKECHAEQYEFWRKTPHARAYAALKETGDHLRYDCIGCHTVGFGHAFYDVREGAKYADVQCECCHGTNPRHVEDPEGSPKSEPVTEKTCLRCHNEHQIRIPFNYAGKLPLVSCPKMKSK